MRPVAAHVGFAGADRPAERHDRRRSANRARGRRSVPATPRSACRNDAVRAPRASTRRPPRNGFELGENDAPGESHRASWYTAGDWPAVLRCASGSRRRRHRHASGSFEGWEWKECVSTTASAPASRSPATTLAVMHGNASSACRERWPGDLAPRQDRAWHRTLALAADVVLHVHRQALAGHAEAPVVARPPSA